ncbi:MAG: glycine zipper domain-containing protein [Gammaproteobacteria bacterium]|nr:glycine zipper domain-containing protein [Gammaproteobacteria bacterium]
MNKMLALVCGLASAPGVALAGVQYHEVPVLDVEPIMATVEVVEPEERCWYEDVRQRPRDTASSATAPLVGALVGGAVGNAVGHNKRNKQIGAVVGAVLGGSIGHDIARRERARSGGVRKVRVVTQEVCKTHDRRRTEQRVTGYLVTYRYAGETYRARTDHRPGETIRVRVRVTPA